MKIVPCRYCASRTLQDRYSGSYIKVDANESQCKMFEFSSLNEGRFRPDQIPEMMRALREFLRPSRRGAMYFCKLGKYQFHWYGWGDWRFRMWHDADNPHQISRMDFGPIAITKLGRWCTCEPGDMGMCKGLR